MKRDQEENLRRIASKAQAANRVKSTFLANMSHEVRRPLHAIVGYSELETAYALTGQLRKKLQG